MSSESNTYVLDTNIFVGYVRDAPYSRHVDQKYEPLSRNHIGLVSVVSEGELRSLAYQFDWGERKKNHLQQLLSRVRTVPIEAADLIDRYAQIDAYSQDALPDNRALDDSDRNMGKNDVWIAATASVIDATLITTDDDFDHLHGEFLDRVYVDRDDEYDL